MDKEIVIYFIYQKNQPLKISKEESFMTNLKNIVEIAEAVNIAAEVLSENKITEKDLEGISMLSPEFKNNLEVLRSILNITAPTPIIEQPKPTTKKVEEKIVESVPEPEPEIDIIKPIKDLEGRRGRNGFDDYVVHEACSIIKEMIERNPDTTITAMAKATGLSPVGLKSIFKGNYTKVSEKYFVLMNGRPVVKKERETPATTTITSDLIRDNSGDILSIFKMSRSLEYAVKLFKKKLEMKEFPIGDGDRIIPILENIKDDHGNIDSSANILRRIHNEYGKIFITEELVGKIKRKEFHPELCNLVF